MSHHYFNVKHLTSSLFISQDLFYFCFDLHNDLFNNFILLVHLDPGHSYASTIVPYTPVILFKYPISTLTDALCFLLSIQFTRELASFRVFFRILSNIDSLFSIFVASTVS